MKKYLVTILSIALMGTLITLAHPYITEKLDKYETYNTIFFGDSITKNGHWDDLLTWDLHNSGYSGFTTSHLVELVDKAVIKYHPKRCYIMGGVNDIKVGIPMSRTKKNFQAIIDTLRAHHITPVIQSTLYTAYPDINKSVDTLDLYLVNLSKTDHIKYIDVNQALSTDHKIKPQYTGDGLHPNQAGYKEWVKLLN